MITTAINDWLNLPPNMEAQTLWATLHDGELHKIQPNLQARTVLLEFDMPHLRQYHKLDDAVRFLMHLEEVQSARVNTWVRWPGGFADIPDETGEERSRRIEEDQAKWREESFDWNTFMEAFATDELLIYNAQMVRSTNSVALQFEGNLNGDAFDDQYFTVFLRAKALMIEQSNGAVLSTKSFIQLGDAYWDAFSARSEARHRE